MPASKCRAEEATKIEHLYPRVWCPPEPSKSQSSWLHHTHPLPAPSRSQLLALSHPPGPLAPCSLSLTFSSSSPPSLPPPPSSPPSPITDNATTSFPRRFPLLQSASSSFNVGAYYRSSGRIHRQLANFVASLLTSPSILCPATLSTPAQLGLANNHFHYSNSSICIILAKLLERHTHVFPSAISAFPISLLTHTYSDARTHAHSQLDSNRIASHHIAAYSHTFFDAFTNQPFATADCDLHPFRQSRIPFYSLSAQSYSIAVSL